MTDQTVIKKLEEQSLEMRKKLLTLCHRAGALHIGGDFSLTDIMTAIWQYKMKYDSQNPKWEGRDRFILSKGHAAGVLYISQAMKGCYSYEDVYTTYGKLDSAFGMHPCSNTLPSVELSTGSLGHGLSIAVGTGLALRSKKNPARVFTVMGDGELQEGTVWEAAMAAGQYKLGNLVGIVDRNGLSLDDWTENEMKLEPLADKWRAFGWNVVTVDGHDMAQIVEALDNLPETNSDIPTVIIAKTIKGKGIGFMEHEPDWHAGSVDSDLLVKCTAELDERFAKERSR